MTVLDFLKGALTKILVTFPDSIRKKAGEDKITHGFVGLRIQQLGKWFGPVGATIMFVVAVACSIIRELLSAKADWNDVKWTVYICLPDLFLFVLISMILDVAFGIQLRAF